MKQPPPRDPPRYLFVARTRCPRCGGTDLQTYRSTRHSDGARSRHTRCRACGAKFIIVLQ